MIKKPVPRLKPDPIPTAEKLKVVVVGEPKVGKTQFLASYCDQKFSDEYEKTIGSDFFVHQGKYGGKNGKLVQISFWDLAGDQAYVEVRNEFYKDCQVLIIMFDITNQKSFDAIEMWMREVGKYAGENVGNIKTFIVGNKLDQAGSRKIKKEDVQAWVKTRDFCGYYEVSAKEQNGYIDLLTDVVKTAIP